MATAGLTDFTVPTRLEAAEPPEARGLRRDEVRLLVSDFRDDSIQHARFRDLPRWLSVGDLLVVNTSGTLNAALPATSESGEKLKAELDDLLDEIDGVLESNAEDFVKSYVQKGGQ